ncbi:uncharacterized protein N7446_007574 [Penicillium canescens]|uniref:uncharacterized protein n=1 Tax=Penicillium canescens TaxID=5083 RepID=UPI0026E0E979|nr:uncharacterized protein N7446_007574 [Penicillium canescens]KAJ6047297.1 hypothetical protein N7444_007099 [Penicillium canescens]KAJ6063454.1 hypothetical protein N7446_007574 [Penicillium canescens]
MAQPPLETFQIGWICALPIEAAAAKEMLDESFGLLGAQDRSDPNTYTLGRVGQHNVAIACLPAGQYGNTSATTVANNMVRTFSKSLRIGLMVGVGGGIPSAAHDIRLGDVVISCPEGTSGGVLQYDMGKVGVGGEFRRTGSLNSPPRSLLTAVNLMRATELTDDPRFPEYVASATERTPRTRKNFGRPDVQQDRLFKPKNEHPATAISCDKCSAEWEERRSERENNDPQLHYGIIASGSAVIKHGWTREQLRLATGALCFEMEAAGLMMDFPCIVIRGICDYADSHKNKQWQGYAALTAASCAKELLGYIPVGHVSQESLVVDACNKLKDEIQGTNKRLDRTYNQQEQHHREKVTGALMDRHQHCHQAFKVSNYTEQKNINPRRVEGTCQWALQSPEYIRWWGSNSNDLLWVSADPGCGKSVLARSIIDDYVQASTPAVTICYFFFKDNDEQNHLSAALCSVLHQLFSQRPHLLRYAIPPWEKNGQKIRQEVDELWRIFVTATSVDVSSKTICIFDALDECRDIDQNRLIEKLQFFNGQPCSLPQNTCLKFLVTSRPYAHIQNRFQVITGSFPHLNLKGEEKNDQIHKEIDLVVKMRVKELAETASLSWDIQQRLEQQLLQMEHRTYLWLHLAIDDIQSTFENSLRPAEESIRMIPPSVNKAYEKILSRVPSSQVNTVRKVLQITVAARRPLTVAEMAIALGIAICPQLRTVAQAGLDPLQVEKKLRRLCGLFVFINNSKIYLIHQTAREFLIEQTSSNSVDFAFSCSLSDNEDQMAHICLRYLLMEDLEEDEDESCSNIRSFLTYSAVHWPDHVRKMTRTSDKEVTNRLHQLYDISGKRFSLWFPIFWRAVKPHRYVPKMRALHLAAFNGHEQEVQFLLAVNKTDVNTADNTTAYPLMWASLNGHDKIGQMLLEHGANINAQGGEYGTALQAACAGGYDKIIQMLLEHGADVNAQGGKYGNALQAACAGGYDKFAQMLLEHGADVNAQGGKYGTALQAACAEGYDKLVQMLLARGADVNAQGEYSPFFYVTCKNALQVACLKGYDKIAEMLLDHGADVNAQGGEFGNALQYACSGEHHKLAQMLLERGADVNTQDGRSGYGLLAACMLGNDKIVKMLLEHGADVNAHQREEHGNALHTACMQGNDKIVKMLLEHGADVNAQGGRYGDGGRYGNALHITCFKGKDKFVQMLLDHGADVNAQGGRCGNALQIAYLEGHDKIVEMLLEHGADVNAQSGKYGTALQAACAGGYDKFAQMLLEHGADVNAQGGKYGTALQAACAEGYDKFAQMLLEHGADVNAQGGKYGTALQAACAEGYDKFAQMLLEHGADVNAQGGEYGTALQAACAEGYDKLAQMLLERGADINAHAQGGEHVNTALQAACVEGHDKIAQMLLDRGAEINAQGGHIGSALQAAYAEGHDKVAQMLLERGADVNAQGGN